MAAARRKVLQAQAAELRDLIRLNDQALRREQAQAAGPLDMENLLCSRPPTAAWEASCILQEESAGDGFSLWLGSADDAINLEALRARNVTAVVNLALGSCEQECLQQQQEPSSPGGRRWQTVEFTRDWYQRALECADFWYLPINAKDVPDYPLHRHFCEVTAFLERCREERRVVLVHCMMGVNRSACACAAFLMRPSIERGATSFDATKSAVDWISQRRTGVFQNVAFLEQLITFGAEKTGEDPSQLEQCGGTRSCPGEGGGGRKPSAVQPRAEHGAAKQRRYACSQESEFLKYLFLVFS
eukprot:gnl/TRDRNA2_/TRDRNA2_157211_c0_seq4.p1 gnl/TRDRNA2_/TRDRNA2_157211_c0~~gnl/TRDRNA2_/TRDRNA2_157211_c0_seq4.p1  ORF type:complete len:301 (-),score=53.90 gnl/TRDRNA2_/TRDRNA2_157211_c0_seq4:197-1099(-)